MGKFCEKCGKPTTQIVNLFGNDVEVQIRCDCQESELKQKLDGIKEMQRLQRIRDIRKRATPIELIESTKEKNFEKDWNPTGSVSKFSRRYAENFKDMLDTNTSIVFCGDKGNGKTFYATCIANYLMEHFFSVCITSISEILNMPIDERNNFVPSLSNYSLVIFDDLGTERKTDFANEIVYQVVNIRYNCKKPIIVTTNFSKAQITNSTSPEYERVFDRLQEMALFVECTGESQRAKLGEEKRKKAISILYGEKN